MQNPYDKHTGLHRGGEAKEVVTGRTLAADNVSRNGNTVTFSIPTTELESYAGYAKLTYKTAVKRGELDTSTNEVKFTNKASAESGSEKFESGSGTVTIKNNVIKKTGEQVSSSNRIKYTILVNESAVALKNGTDFLGLVDTMDAKCTLGRRRLRSMSGCMVPGHRWLIRTIRRRWSRSRMKLARVRS
ncbi:hypothetical protein AAAV44_04875 [Collinsella sp. CLA-AP-H1]|uniref:hypothetical protein n=1 Tax=Collinsella sp. CLA-AP-H1 TaxID=3136232 RepID=UPI0032BF664E